MNGDAQTSDVMQQHLIYHKALIDDNVGNERVNKYIRILGESDSLKLEDPTDEAIRSIFSLVFENHLDPWEIDLHEFVRLYSSKVEKNDYDMIVAGKLVLMAWKILRMQSDRTREASESAEEEDGFLFGMDADFFADELYVPSVPSVSFAPVVRRESVRPVTMMELLNAFEDAREEMEVHAERERLKLELKAKAPRKFDNKAHDEDDERDVEFVYEKIQKLGAGEMLLSDLYTTDTLMNIKIFLAVLHLVRDGKLSVRQEELPYGEVYIELKVEWAAGTVEDASPEAVVHEAVI